MGKRRFVPEDLYKFSFISDPQFSPDGNKIAYVVSKVHEGHKKYQSSLWFYDVERKENTQFTFDTGDSRPRWSPDGTKIAFVSSRKGKKQLYVINSVGGEAKCLCELKHGVGDPVWSPDGRHIAFAAKSALEDTMESLLKVKDDAKKENSDDVVKVITNLKYKTNGAGLDDDKKSHLFVVSVESGEVRKVTEGDYEHSMPAWSPDGKGLVFSSNRMEDHDFRIRHRDLWYVSLEDGMLQQLTDGKGQYNLPVFSPDGQYLAYYGHHIDFDSATLYRLFVRDMKSGEIRCLTENFDRSLGAQHSVDMRLGMRTVGPRWDNDSKHIFVATSSLGQTHVFRVSVDGEVCQVTKGDIQVDGYSLTADSRQMVVVYSDWSQPGDMSIVDIATGDMARCTEVNKAILNECHVAELEEINVKGVDDWDIQSWIMKPVGFKEGTKYPLILEVHGGPHALYASNFFFEFQLLAANGYVVIFGNPRGGQGYGQEFANAVRGDYGGNDYRDLMKIVDYAMTLDYVDKDRMGVTGGSYGGFMTNWIVGHTDIFKAAVTQRSISNWRSFYGVSDIGYYFGGSEVGCTPWGDPDKIMKHSPIAYVENIKTPLLIIHGEEDLRCPIEQAEQLYVFLKYLKQEVEFMRFPGENHELSRSGRPDRRVARLKGIVGWFNKHIERNAE